MAPEYVDVAVAFFSHALGVLQLAGL